MTKITSIPFLNIESIPLLIKDFLNQNIQGTEDLVFNRNNFEKKITEKSQIYSSEQRENLYQVLERQHRSLSLSEVQKKNLTSLKSEKTFTVVTGHQLNLFSGPVFFIYKILQTIKTTDFLKKEFPNYHFVPLFWLASEDHDFEEIHHFKTQNHYYETKETSGGAVGRIRVEEQSFIKEFENEFKDSVFGTELIRWIKEAYAKGNTLADATKILVNHLFSECGLLIIDGDDASLKKQMVTIFKDELLNRSLFHQTKNQVEILEHRYGKVQVNPREINLFYLSETRNRIEFQDEKFHIIDKNISFTEDEILAELENHPEKFSPNALMRPIYQEKILPNLAYIGGNAEVMYWLELVDYFKYLGLATPLLIPRNSMLWLTEKTFKKIEKLDLKIEDFFKNFALIIKDKLLNQNDLSQLIDDKELELKKIFEKIKQESKRTDKTFENLVKAEEIRQLKSFLRMRKRLLRAEKIKNKEYLERIEQLFLEIHPAKNWQERVLNFSVFYSDFGREWLQNCYAALDVEKSELNILQV